MQSFFIKFARWIKSNSKLSAVILLVVIGVFVAVEALGSSDEGTRYILANAQRGNIVSSISGSGQVSASDQVVITAKASGDVTSLNVREGQEVRTGAIIATLDSRDAYYALETARISHDKLVTTDPAVLKSARVAVGDAEGNLTDVYVSARASLSNASTNMSDVLAGLDKLYVCNGGYLGECRGYVLTSEKRGYRERGSKSWYEADEELENYNLKYKTITKTSTNTQIESVLAEAYGVALVVAEAAKDAKDTIVHFQNHPDSPLDKSAADSAYSAVAPLVASANAAVTDITASRNAITNSKRNLDTTKTSLAELEDGPDVLDVRSSRLNITQREKALADYSLRAPFAGVIAAVAIKRGDSINTGAQVATLITRKRVAEISLNEIDVAKVKVGQKATLTFDALEDLTISGEVAQVEAIGTISQGVVNYKVKIAFDVEDERVKSGMSVSSSIVTAIKQDVLVVPISALKSQGESSYVEVVSSATFLESDVQTAGVVLSSVPTRVPVETGLSSDESIEILTGLEEGDEYVVRSIAPASAAKASTASSPSLFGARSGGVRVGGSNQR